MNHTQHERRQHLRENACFHIEIQIEPSQSTWSVKLRDISEGGMSFVVDDLTPYHKNEKLCVSIPEYDANNVLQHQCMQAEIVWLQEQDLLNPQAWIGLKLLTEA